MSLNSRDNQAEKKGTTPQGKKMTEQATKAKKIKNKMVKKDRKRKRY